MQSRETGTSEPQKHQKVTLSQIGEVQNKIREVERESSGQAMVNPKNPSKAGLDLTWGAWILVSQSLKSFKTRATHMKNKQKKEPFFAPIKIQKPQLTSMSDTHDLNTSSVEHRIPENTLPLSQKNSHKTKTNNGILYVPELQIYDFNDGEGPRGSIPVKFPPAKRLHSSETIYAKIPNTLLFSILSS